MDITAPLSDADYLEGHILAMMLKDDPGDRRLQEAAWKLVNRWREEGKLPEPPDRDAMP